MIISGVKWIWSIRSRMKLRKVKMYWIHFKPKFNPTLMCSETWLIGPCSNLKVGCHDNFRMLPATAAACTNIHMGGGFEQALGVPNVRDFFGHHFFSGLPSRDWTKKWSNWRYYINLGIKTKNQCIQQKLPHTSFENCNISFLSTFISPQLSY